MKRINALLLIVILALSVFGAPLAALADSEEVVAKVNGAPLPGSSSCSSWKRNTVSMPCRI